MMTPEKVRRRYEEPIVDNFRDPGLVRFLWLAKGMQPVRPCYELRFWCRERDWILFRGAWHADGVAEGESRVSNLVEVRDDAWLQAFRESLSPEQIARCTAAALSAPPSDPAMPTFESSSDDARSRPQNLPLPCAA